MAGYLGKELMVQLGLLGALIQSKVNHISHDSAS
jgi:hypothetical protein